jgi:hypothetical protein
MISDTIQGCYDKMQRNHVLLLITDLERWERERSAVPILDFHIPDVGIKALFPNQNWMTHVLLLITNLKGWERERNPVSSVPILRSRNKLISLSGLQK